MKEIVLTHYKSILIIVTILMMVILVPMISPGTFTSSMINLFGHWIRQNKLLFLLFHGLIAIAIYFVLGSKINSLVKKHGFSAEMRKKLIQFRWCFIGTAVLFDVFFFYLME